MVAEGRTVFHYFILVIGKFLYFMSFFRDTMWVSFFLLNKFALQSLNMQHLALAAYSS